MDALDFYALLEIPQDADLTQIKNAYKRKAFELHPDKNLGKKTATQEFQVLQSIRDTLTDPITRGTYDLKYADIKRCSEAKKEDKRKQQAEAAYRQAEEAKLYRKRQDEAKELSSLQARRGSLDKLQLQITSLKKERNMLGEKMGKVIAAQLERKAKYERAKRTWFGTLFWGPLEIGAEEQEKRNNLEREDLQQISSLRIKLDKLTNQLDPLTQSYDIEEKAIKVLEEKKMRSDRLEKDRLAREMLQREANPRKAQEEAARRENMRWQEEARAHAERARKEREAQQKRQEQERLQKEKERAESIRQAQRKAAAAFQGHKASTRTSPEKSQNSHSSTQSGNDCRHPNYWHKLQGPNNCGRCHQRHQKFIMQCPACHMLCCYRCKDKVIEQTRSENHYSEDEYSYNYW